MEQLELEELVQALKKRTEYLETRQRYFLAGVAVLLAVFLLAASQSAQGPQENLKARAVSIVDSSGVVRLVLGAPVPNPVVQGKIKERRVSATGIIFNDAAGRAILYLDTNGAPHLPLRDEQGHQLVSLPDAWRQRSP